MFLLNKKINIIVLFMFCLYFPSECNSANTKCQQKVFSICHFIMCSTRFCDKRFEKHAANSFEFHSFVLQTLCVIVCIATNTHNISNMCEVFVCVSSALEKRAISSQSFQHSTSKPRNEFLLIVPVADLC